METIIITRLSLCRYAVKIARNVPAIEVGSREAALRVVGSAFVVMSRCH